MQRNKRSRQRRRKTWIESKMKLAFYDALEINDSAVQVLGDDNCEIIAREIAEKVRANATIDWTIRESARAKLMVLGKTNFKQIRLSSR